MINSVLFYVMLPVLFFLFFRWGESVGMKKGNRESRKGFYNEGYRAGFMEGERTEKAKIKIRYKPEFSQNSFLGIGTVKVLPCIELDYDGMPTKFRWEGPKQEVGLDELSLRTKVEALVQDGIVRFGATFMPDYSGCQEAVQRMIQTATFGIEEKARRQRRLEASSDSNIIDAEILD